jgi:hypothetical protein
MYGVEELKLTLNGSNSHLLRPKVDLGRRGQQQLHQPDEWMPLIHTNLV